MAVGDAHTVEDTRRIAAIAAFGMTASILFIPISILVGMALGARPPSGADLASQVAAIVANPIGYGSTGFVFLILGPSLIVLALALHEHLRRAAPFALRIGTTAGIIGGTLILVAGFGPSTLAAELGTIDAQDHGAAVATYLANTLVTGRLSTAGFVMFGAFALIASVLGHRARLVSRMLSYLGILLGIAFITSELVPAGPLQFVGVPILLVWSLWLGIALFRGEPRVARSTGATTPAHA